MDTLWQDVKYAFRMLGKTPGFTAVAVFTLALGIGANAAIFSVVNRVLLQPLPYPNSERLVRLWDRNEPANLRFFSVSVPNYFAWRDRNRVFAAMGAYREGNFNLAGADGPQQVSGARVTASLFDVLAVKPTLGRGILPEEDTLGGAKVAVLSYGLWQSRFGGDPNLPGKQITLDGESHTVVGIMPRGFEFPQRANVSVLVPYRLYMDPQNRGAHFLRVLGRMKPGVTLEQADAEMAAIAGQLEQEFPGTNSGFTVALLPLLEATVGDLRPALLILFAAVGIVLLIACVNIANLLLARATTRQKEMAIRAALGAGRPRLARQLLTESTLLGLMGGAVGLLTSAWMTKWLLGISAGNLPRQTEISMDGWVLAFSLGLSLLTGIIFGLAPAVAARRVDLNEVLKEGSRSSPAGRGHHRVRSVLVVGEVALALMLVIGGTLLVRSFVHLQQARPGFDPAGVLAARIAPVEADYPDPPRRAAFYREALDRIDSVQGVEAAGIVHRLPLSGNSMTVTLIEGRPVPPPGQMPGANWRAVSPGYFQALHIPLLRGRMFTESETWTAGRGKVALINQAMAERFWLSEDPLGRRFGQGPNGPWTEVIGVVADVKEDSLAEPAQPAVYLPYGAAPVPSMVLVVRGEGDPLALVPAIRGQVLQVNAHQPISSVVTMEAFLGQVVAEPRFNTMLLNVFAGLALLLAMVGLYGVMGYVVSQRTHEIGLRMALGAHRRDILRLVVGRGMALVGVGVVAGLAGGLGTARLLESQLYGVQATDPWTFAAATAAVSAVGLLACYVPARRATRVDPMIALRYE